MENEAAENKNLLQHIVDDILAILLLFFSCSMFYLFLYML